MHRSLTQLKKLDWLLEERQFTDSARLIVRQAGSRAQNRGFDHVDASSYAVLLLWTMIRWERKIGLVALETMGVDLEMLAREIDEILTRRADEHPVAFDPRTNSFVYEKTGEAFFGWDYDVIAIPLFDQAAQAARKIHHDYVGTEHLLLAVISAADPELKQVLDGHFMRAENVEETILEVLGK